MEASFAGLKSGYSVKVTTGTITSSNTFVPAGGGDNVTFTCPSYDPSYYANAINFALLPYSFVPIPWIGSDWKVEITVNGACSTSTPSTVYFKTQNASVMANYYAYRPQLSGYTSDNFKTLQTTPTISSAMPTGVTNAAYRGALALAPGWTGPASAGVFDINVDPGANWVLSVYEVDGTTGIRRQISGVDVPNLAYHPGSGSLSMINKPFTECSKGFKASEIATGYVDESTDYVSGYEFFVEYYQWAKTSPAELVALSAKTWCTEFSVTNSTGCTVVNRSFFRIAHTSFPNGHTAKSTDEDGEILLQEDVEIRVFPNPASQNVIVMLPYGTDATEFLLRDNTGKLVLQKNKLHNGKNEINLSDLANGVYFYEVMVNNTLKHGKLIKL